MSKRASELAQWSARAKRAVRSKLMSEGCERTSERMSEWPSTLRVDSLVILPTVHRFASFPLVILSLSLC